MATATIKKQVRAALEALVDQTTDAVLATLKGLLFEDGEAAPARKPRKAKTAAASEAAPKAKRKGKKAGGGADGRRLPEETEALAKQIVAWVAAHNADGEGVGVKQIGEGLKLETGDLQLPIAKALKSKLLKKTGQRAGTKYHATAKGTKTNSAAAEEKAAA